MNPAIFKLASLIALMVTIFPSLIYFLGIIDLETMKWITLGGTIAWFAFTPAWLGREREIDDDQVQI